MEQAEFIQWMKRNLPAHRVFAIPNGGLRAKSVATKLKATGVVSGVPDLFVPSLRTFIEMKRTKGSQVSEEQRDWMHYLQDVGYNAKVCYGKDEAVAFIKEIFVALNK
jgi:hypothetical protein